MLRGGQVQEEVQIVRRLIGAGGGKGKSIFVENDMAGDDDATRRQV
jgi:hypothetical protein